MQVIQPMHKVNDTSSLMTCPCGVCTETVQDNCNWNFILIMSQKIAVVRDSCFSEPDIRYLKHRHFDYKNY